MTYLFAYIGSAVVFLGLDYVWLSRIARDFYASSIGSLMREAPDFLAAGVFYLFYIGGIVFFAVMPAESWKGALLRGALLGLLAYGTYDMTNLATLKGWPWRMAAVDMAWGTALTALAALGGYLAAKAA
ncbi:DUF2177 family protein [Parvibaculum sp.]|jgi:uncharacterized membrane protein|uniref:DUF2177 family protein n=1 Tax=Parvibaculum sp. TaxID=2024848 RepID=UPI000C51A5CF|nr:DUF2177 family protein [Parvibaculum sp.]HAC57612.1 DUF2177 domain-containing protein [Rhodobiaceae bacterium]MAU62265.1 hypothetical protein [Parvibaculum sp.]MBO6667157.1 DUF2177 family protein [Parvibaculum sp.]MBO6693081.1 DUF2177 family protein [Parvibaculum sp.]MBO6713710.1 DUF2177 family protein [Parvibaculum sp.]|tara:strand:+ start:10113 stop:10499 length:387 start_codon:yes stop_codon:yes gene_type:complete